MPSFSSCERNRGGDDRVVAWLCDADHRVDLAGRPSDFLESVHSQYHRRGRMTPLQIRAITRFMERSHRVAAARIANIPATEAEYEDESEGTTGADLVAAYEGPLDITGRWTSITATIGAMYNEAQWVYSGEYGVSHQSVNYKFQIRTMVRSNTNSLIGKRVVSVMYSGRWTMFAFVSVTGHLSVWRRFQNLEDGEGVWSQIRQAASTLLESFRPVDRDSEWSTWDSPDGSYPARIYRSNTLCRDCNGVMSDLDDRDEGVHGSIDCRSQAVPLRRNPSASVPTPRRTPSNPHPTRPAFTSPPPPEPVVILSELGTNWER